MVRRRGNCEPKCWRCNGKGHVQTDCPVAVSEIDGAKKSCFLCGSLTHLAMECPLNDRVPGAPWPRIKRVVQSHCRTDNQDVSKRMSVVITTSPVPSHPSTMMLEAVLNSFSRVVGLEDCPLIIVCDGFRSATKSTWKAGQITVDAAAQYDGYLKNLEQLLETGGLPPGTKLVFLDGHNGQAMGVKAGVSHVETPFVLVHQHDLEFPFDFQLSTVLDVLEDEANDVKYVGMPLLTNLHYESIAWQHHGVKVQEVAHRGIRLVPVIFWYDSTHITSVKHYQKLVFGPNEHYDPGNFVEETFGVRQRSDIMAVGMSAHAKYGTYHCLSHACDGSRRPLICHLNGVRFLTPEQRAERGFPADPPVENFPSRTVMNKKQRKLKAILDVVLGFAGLDAADILSVKDILSRELNLTRIRSSNPASKCLPTSHADA